MPEKLTLTVSSAKAAEPRAGKYSIPSTRAPGLALVVRGTSKVFYWSGRVRQGPMVALRLGAYGTELTVHEAEQRALDALRLAKAGTDPRAERERDRVARKVEDRKALATFGAVCDAYLDAFKRGEAATNKRGGAPKADSIDRERLSLAKARAVLGDDLSLADLGRVEALKLREAHAGKLSGASRRHMWDAAARVLRHAVEHGLTERNALADLTPPHASEARDRYLTAEEVAKVWSAAGKLADPWGDLIRFLIATPVRLSNATGARWEDVRGDVLHLETTKGGDPWPVPLTEQACAILSARRKPESSGLIFPSRGDSKGRGIGGEVQGHSKIKAKVDELAGVTGWRLHDLRRTCASLLGDRREDFDPTAMELWLQHRPAGIRGVYQTSRSLPSTRRMARMWGEELGAILVEHKVAGAAAAPEVTRIGDAAR